MAIAPVQFKSSGSSGAYVNISPTAGNALFLASVISAAYGGAPSTFQAMSAVAGGGTALATFTVPTELANQTFGTSDIQLVGAYLLNVPNGVASILGTWSAGVPGYIYLDAVEMAGVSTSAGYVTGVLNGPNAPGTGANAITSGTASVSAAASYLLGLCIDNNTNTTFVAGTGYTAVAAALNGCLAEGRTISSSGSYAATFTDATNGSADGYGVVMFALEAVSASLPLMGQICM